MPESESTMQAGRGLAAVHDRLGADPASVQVAHDMAGGPGRPGDLTAGKLPGVFLAKLLHNGAGLAAGASGRVCQSQSGFGTGVRPGRVAYVR
jgi:hypothetical protein